MERIAELNQRHENNAVWQYKLKRLDEIKHRDRLQVLTDLAVNNQMLAYQLARYHSRETQS